MPGILESIANAVAAIEAGFPDTAPTPVAQCPTRHFTQEKANSCVIASSRNMIFQLTGKDIQESQLREEMNTIIGEPHHDWDKNGIDPVNAVKLLEQHGVKAEAQYGVSNDDLAKLTTGGKPVLIGFKTPGHRVMLDSVTLDKDGNKIYQVRDPDPAFKGAMRQMTETEFNKKRNATAVVIVPK